eukprot:TRINITY_DN7388_c0_g1_i1.p1 TRINITY_DN7388_c0_g1~~TRINITY_DN7388_c0_g1_i1.p1  ORF type:complete len:1510 (-),score=277.44 TRINITY_DN7388_c0_g1_i1:60-4589(-)
MPKACLVVVAVAIVLAAFVVAIQGNEVGDQQTILQQTAANITAQKQLNAGTIGVTLAGHIDFVFHKNSLAVSLLNVTINNNELVIWAKTTVWNGATAVVTFTFFFATQTTTDLQMQLQLQVTGLALPALYSTLYASGGKSQLALLSQLKANSTSDIDFVYSTMVFNNHQPGVTLSTTTTFAATSFSSSPASPSLLQAFRTLQPNATAGSTTLATHVYVRNEHIFELRVSESSSAGFALASDLRCGTYSIDVNVVDDTVDILLAGEFTLTLNSQSVQFAVSSTWASTEKHFTFTGILQNTWNNAFGFPWLSLTSATVNVNVGPAAAVDGIKFTAAGLVSLGTNSPLPASITVDADGTGDFLISIANVPFTGAQFGAMYSAITRQSQFPSILSEITGGQVSIAISNYDSGTVKKGLTISSQVTIASGGAVAKALSVLLPSASTHTYELDLYLPIFSGPTGSIAVTFKETGSFAIGNSVSVADYKLLVTVPESDLSSSGFLLSAELAVAVQRQTTPVLFDIATSWQQAQPSQITFTGSLQSTWVRPFGVSWVNISSAQVQLVAQIGSAPTVLDVTASGNVLWGGSVSRTSFTIDVNPSTGAFLVSASGIPFGDSNTHYGNVYSAVTGATAPSVLSQLESASGTVGFSLATYASGSVQAGFTFTADVTLAASSQLSDAARAIDSAQATRKYGLSLYVPVYSQQPRDVSFSLTETGAIALSEAVTLNSYSLKVAVQQGGQAFTLNAATEASIVVKQQSTPIVFDLTGQWQSSLKQFQFTGALKSGSTWNNPFGLNWMTISAATVSMTVGASKPLDIFTITATTDFSFSPSSNTQVQITVKGDGNVLFSVNNIPLGSLAVLFITITQGATVPHVFLGLNVAGTISFSVATYASGTVQKGFTLTSAITLAEGPLLTVAKDLNPNAADSKSYKVSFFAPIFGPAPAYDVQISVTETGSFQIGVITCESYTITATVSSGQAAFTVSTVLSIPLPRQINPIRVSVSGGWQEQTGANLKGALIGTWDHPFGATWLTITSAQASLAIKGGSLFSLSFSGSGTIGTATENVAASYTISVAGQTFSLSTTIDAKWSFSDFVKLVTGTEFELIKDAKLADSAKFSVTLASSSGLTIGAEATLQGGLLAHIQALDPKSGTINGALVFSLTVNIPVFTNPADVTLSLSVSDPISFTRNFAYESMNVSITVEPLAVSASLDFQATFAKNPTLNFVVGGSITSDGSYTFTGEMVGTWANPFGLRYFDLSNVIIEIGVNPALCPVDACFADIGLGCEMQIGTKTIKFDGNAAAPDFENLYLAGSITGSDGMALTVMDVVSEWNAMFPSFAIPAAAVPQGWGIVNSGFFFAPVNGHFGNIYYSAGFGVTGGIRVIDIDLELSVNCTDTTADWCNFAFHVDVDLDAYTKFIKKQLKVAGYEPYTFDEAYALGIDTSGPSADNPRLVVFRVNSVELTQWSISNIAHNAQPHWSVDIEVFSKTHNLSFDTEMQWLSGSFEQYFKQWLAYLFHV